MQWIDENWMNEHFKDYKGEELERKKEELRWRVGNTIRNIKKRNKKKLSEKEKLDRKNPNPSLFCDTD